MENSTNKQQLNQADIELKLINLHKAKEQNLKKQLLEERGANNIIKLTKLSQEYREILSEIFETEALINNIDDVPIEIYKYGRWYDLRKE